MATPPLDPALRIAIVVTASAADVYGVTAKSVACVAIAAARSTAGGRLVAASQLFADPGATAADLGITLKFSGVHSALG